MRLRSCVHPSGQFVYGVHKPSYTVANQRENDFLLQIGAVADAGPCLNRDNFPEGDVRVPEADWIYEIPNPFPFRGTTFISHSWAAAVAADPASIALPGPAAVSMHQSLQGLRPQGNPPDMAKQFRALPASVLLALAATSTDPEDLVLLADMSCEFTRNAAGAPTGLVYKKQEAGNGKRPLIHDTDLFETVANNIHLPDLYKEIMVLRPGVQGNSEIVGEYSGPDCHVFEYLRRNSYIPWGHHAANMAHDSVRYRIEDLSHTDMHGLRHLYYQRTYLRLAARLGLALPPARRTLTVDGLEELRRQVLRALAKKNGQEAVFTATLWGWNYGYDFASSGYRLHASHQQVHQQFALVPETVPAWHHGEQPAAEPLPSYGCGDLIADFCEQYKKETGRDFFPAYLEAIRNNRRMDRGENNSTSLIVHEDENVMLFVPKAQTSQWELQITTLDRVGNIMEADTATRASLDRALFIAQKILARLGARLVSSIELAKRLTDGDAEQRLLYALLPKLPQSMGAFSEAQFRWINGHFPEDFAAACRLRLPEVLAELDNPRTEE